MMEQTVRTKELGYNADGLYIVEIAGIRLHYGSKEQYEEQKQAFQDYHNSEEKKAFERELWFGKV